MSVVSPPHTYHAATCCAKSHSSSQNRPTNVAQKEADVNQKLQLYGIYSGMVKTTAQSLEVALSLGKNIADLVFLTAFANGKVPSVNNSSSQDKYMQRLIASFYRTSKSMLL